MLQQTTMDMLKYQGRQHASVQGTRPNKENAANIELSCDQSGIGFTPIIGVDFKTGKWNFSAKYEFKTRIRLKNKAVNQAPSISALPDNLSRQMVGTLTQVFTNKGMTPENACCSSKYYSSCFD